MNSWLNPPNLLLSSGADLQEDKRGQLAALLYVPTQPNQIT